MTTKMSKPRKSSQPNTEMISETIAAILTADTMTDAAKLLKISRRSMYERMERYPEIRQAIDSVKQEAADILAKNTTKAAKVIVGKLDDRKRDFDAAKEVLDRAGVGTNKGKAFRARQDDEGNMTVEFLEFDE